MTDKHPLHINQIRLEHALPAVFADQPHRPSQVWEGDVVLERGKTYIIAAASGTGKSSLCAYIYGARRDYSGHICFDGQDVSAFTIDHWLSLRRTALAYLPQELDLFPELSAWQNIELKRRLTDFTPQSRVEEWLRQLGIADRRDFPVGKMSIGQQQRVGIARAFVSSPKVIFADEPTGNLDSRTSKQVLYRMLEMSKNSGVTFVMVTHEPDLAECADRIVTILDGKVCSNVVQDEETKKKNRDALFADLEGNLDIGGEAAKEQKK